ncbi:MFS transporter [Billgrantia lactosivorans]|uniref:MFS transporter n=1 Tax=Billgrantia lactosivorans TaxID=2185141 RepID=UPI0015D02AF0|nr:MFS transporter [Halomonas lactosivorans]
MIARFGAQRILIGGATLLIGTVLVANLVTSLAHFWVALGLLGVGWNFPFAGGSAMLSTVHSEAERGKVRGINDPIIFTLVAIGSLMAGRLFHHLGWEALNLAMVPLILLVALATLWFGLKAKSQLASQVSGPPET